MEKISRLIDNYGKKWIWDRLTKKFELHLTFSCRRYNYQIALLLTCGKLVCFKFKKRERESERDRERERDREIERARERKREREKLKHTFLKTDKESKKFKGSEM